MEGYSGYIAICAAYLIIAMVVAWTIVWTKGHLAIRTITIFITVVFACILHYTVPDILGWPTDQSPPENAILYGLKINAPNEASEGSIIYWMIHKDKLQSGVPRAYREPYSIETHKKLLELMKRRKRGDMIVAGKKKGKKKGKKGQGLETRMDKRLEIKQKMTLIPKD
jgi:hypothetical protein